MTFRLVCCLALAVPPLCFEEAGAQGRRIFLVPSEGMRCLIEHARDVYLTWRDSPVVIDFAGCLEGTYDKHVLDHYAQNSGRFPARQIYDLDPAPAVSLTKAQIECIINLSDEHIDRIIGSNPHFNIFIIPCFPE